LLHLVACSLGFAIFGQVSFRAIHCFILLPDVCKPFLHKGSAISKSPILKYSSARLFKIRTIKNSTASGANSFVFPSKEKVRSRQIKEIVRRSLKGHNKISVDFEKNLNTYLNKVCRIMEEKSIDRTKVYLGELSNQLTKLDKPVSSFEKSNFENFLREVSALDRSVESNFTHLRDYTDGVEWLR
jgi:hypothetical protein